MSKINLLKDHQDQVVSGQYLLREVTDRQTQHGDRYKTMRFSDCSGDIRVYAWESSGLLECLPLTMPARVHANLYVRSFNSSLIADLRNIHVLEPHEVTNAAALLALQDCPEIAQPALSKLVNLVDTLEPPELCDFLNRVLMDERIADGLVTCKGSQAHHHQSPGGLLEHSVEVMEIARDMAGDRLSALECSIIQIAALLHDLGKLRSIGSGRVRPVHCQLVRHETQTHRLLEIHLERLRSRAPEIATGLDYIFDFLAQAKAERRHAKFLGAEIVVAADHLSAALVNNRRLSALLDKTMPKSQRRAVTQQGDNATLGRGINNNGRQA